MAKDGTNRGGARIGAGAKKKPLADRIAEGNPGKRELTVIDFTDSTVDLEGQPMPKPSKMLSAKQKNGKKLVAAEVYKKTWNWLHERGCAALVSPELLERYAMSVARWIQCEEAITEFGFLAKHPTTGNAIGRSGRRDLYPQFRRRDPPCGGAAGCRALSPRFRSLRLFGTQGGLPSGDR